MSGKIREKSGNFEVGDKWQPCTYLFKYLEFHGNSVS